MLRIHTLLVASGLILALAPAARAACGGAQLCNPGDDPCIVDAPCSITAGGTFDLGGRALQTSAARLAPNASQRPFGASGPRTRQLH